MILLALRFYVLPGVLCLQLPIQIFYIIFKLLTMSIEQFTNLNYE